MSLLRQSARSCLRFSRPLTVAKPALLKRLGGLAETPELLLHNKRSNNFLVFTRSSSSAHSQKRTPDDSQRPNATFTPPPSSPPLPPPPQASAWNVANAITVGRLFAAPLTGYCILSGDYELALGGLIYAGASDWLDGFLARRYHLHTVVGSFLDPVADKLLISTTTVCLAYQDVIPVWLVALIIGRDVALVAGYTELSRIKLVGFFGPGRLLWGGGQPLKPHFVSKVNTGLQIGLGFAGVLSAGHWVCIPSQFVDALGLATAATTTASAASYGREFISLRFRKR